MAGVGIIERGTLTDEQDAGSRAALHQALEAAAPWLDGGGSGAEAVEAAVRILEDDRISTRRAGGAGLHIRGRIEHDASIMEGAATAAGAVAGTSHTRHPVSLARSGDGKEPARLSAAGSAPIEFSEENGLEQVPNEWFHIPERRPPARGIPQSARVPRRSTST
jgi:beta-aspartyl-peptidase (threonine type)